MKEKKEIKWLKKPESHDYPNAYSFLCLIYDEQTASTFIGRLKRAPVIAFEAKDIFRASGLRLLEIDNYHVNLDRKRIKKGESLSPLLLVRDSANGKVLIADGYHRVCAVYSFKEDAVIPCKIV